MKCRRLILLPLVLATAMLVTREVCRRHPAIVERIGDWLGDEAALLNWPWPAK